MIVLMVFIFQDATADQVKLMELGSNLALTLDLDEDTVTGCLKTLQVHVPAETVPDSNHRSNGLGEKARQIWAAKEGVPGILMCL